MVHQRRVVKMESRKVIRHGVVRSYGNVTENIEEEIILTGEKSKRNLPVKRTEPSLHERMTSQLSGPRSQNEMETLRIQIATQLELLKGKDEMIERLTNINAELRRTCGQNTAQCDGELYRWEDEEINT